MRIGTKVVSKVVLSGTADLKRTNNINNNKNKPSIVVHNLSCLGELCRGLLKVLMPPSITSVSVRVRSRQQCCFCSCCFLLLFLKLTG